VYINGYAASLVFFAGHCIKRGIILKEICPTLKVCIPTSETCTKDDRDILQKGFGIKVVNEYGCAEMDVIAFEDEDGDWITSNENVFIEVVDDDNKPLPNGSTGKILLTTLYNKAIPLIRYEVGDIGTLSTIKKGNYNILQNLSGRTNDFAIMPNGRKVPALTFYYVTKTLIKEHLEVKEFIIKQISLNEFIVEYVGGVEFSDEIKRIIQDAFDKYLEPGLQVSFSKVERVERGKTGKFKQFISLIK
jgi:phenylacetate-CoA ligase